jgi:hypothetical protein
MPRYFFHLAGDIPARDRIGHDCEDDENARSDGNFIAHRIGSERPEMIRKENYISVTNEDGREIARIALASTTV